MNFADIFVDSEFSPERCAAPDLNADTVLATFSRTCYEFHVTRGENFDKARQICQSHGRKFLYQSQNHYQNVIYFLSLIGGDLMHDFRGPSQDYVLSELDRRKAELRTQLVWIGAQKEPGFTSRVWKWVNGMYNCFITPLRIGAVAPKLKF